MRYGMETVSIIIPIYNAQRYIEACLDSIRKQSYQHIEVLLIDDGSNDNSGAICDNYAKQDQRFTVYHRKNAGVSASRNFGLKHSKGKYILYVDADDTIEADMVEKCVHLAESNHADLVICSFRYYIMDDNRIVENSLGCDFCATEMELFRYWFSVLIEKEILNPPWNKLVRKDLLEANHIRFCEKYSICEDMAFSVQTIAASKKTVLTREMYYNYYLKSSGTLVFKFHENYFEALTSFYKTAYKYCSRFDNNRKQIKTLNTLYVKLIIMFLNQIYTMSNWDIKTRLAKMREIGKNDKFLYAIKNVSLNKKKKLVCWLLQTEHLYLLHILYRIKSKKDKWARKGDYYV